MKQLFLKASKRSTGILLWMSTSFPQRDLGAMQPSPPHHATHRGEKWCKEVLLKDVWGDNRCRGSQWPLCCKLCDSMTVFSSQLWSFYREKATSFFFPQTVPSKDAAHEKSFKGMAFNKWRNTQRKEQIILLIVYLLSKNKNVYTF